LGRVINLQLSEQDFIDIAAAFDFIRINDEDGLSDSEKELAERLDKIIEIIFTKNHNLDHYLKGKKMEASNYSIEEIRDLEARICAFTHALSESMPM